MPELQVDAILPKIDTFCSAIADRGVPIPRCWGFMDGTIHHGVEYQSVETPEGILRHMWGPCPGRRLDLALLAVRGLENVLESHFNDDQSEAWCSLGDSAYPITPSLIVPRKENLSDGER